MIKLLLAGLLGYLLGAVPTGVIVCRVLRGEDVRQHGSSHTGGLNVSRLAGLGAGTLTAVTDFFLAAAAVTVTARFTDDPWATTAAGVMAVVGHNWSIFIRFGGGIGLSTLTGALLPLLPLHAFGALVASLIFWWILYKPLHIHRARATILAMIAIGPLLWALGFPPSGILLGILGGIVVIVKILPDWNRKYK